MGPPGPRGLTGSKGEPASVPPQLNLKGTKGNKGIRVCFEILIFLISK